MNIPNETAGVRSKALSHAEGDVMPRLNGQPFRCECECNVFRWVQAPTYAAIDVLACNACGALYEGEPAMHKGERIEVTATAPKAELQIIGPTSPIPRPMPRRSDIRLPKGSFSFSQFRLEKQCGACYEQRYVLKAPMVVKPPLVVGSAIHEGLAHGRRALRENRRVPIGELMEAVGEAFDRSLQGLDRQGQAPEVEPVLKLGKSDKSWGDVKDQAITTARFTVQQVLEAESKHQVVAVEAEIAMHGVFPFAFAAYADRMLDDASWDSFGHIGDDKSAGKDEPPDVWTAWQVTTYSLPFWLAGELVDVGVNQHIKTKVPNVHLWTEPGYSFRPSAEQHHAVYDMILHSAERVSAGRFEPGPHPYGCDYEHPRYPRFGIVVPEAAVA